jgi:hypothetical protein
MVGDIWTGLETFGDLWRLLESFGDFGTETETFEQILDNALLG